MFNNVYTSQQKYALDLAYAENRLEEPAEENFLRHPAKTLDYSNVSVTVCPSLPSPKTPAMTTAFFKMEEDRGANPEFKSDPKSAKSFDKIDTRSDWKHLSTEIQARLKLRGIAKDIDYISDHLSAYANEIQDEIDAEDEAERLAEIAEFNLHISKLKPKSAAIMVLRIREHWTFTPIGKLLNISDQQAENLFQDAEKYFNSDMMQVDFIGHQITLDSPVDELIPVLIAGACSVRSPAGRKPKPKNNSPKPQNGDLFGGVF